METFLFTLAIFVIAFLLLGIRILLVRDGEFHGSCSTQNQALHDQGVDCGGCVKKENDICIGDDESGLMAAANLTDPNRTRNLSRELG